MTPSHVRDLGSISEPKSRKKPRLGRPPELHEVSRITRQRLVVDEITGCWTWTGRRFSGYGPYKRLYERYVATVPKGFDIHHVCHNGPGGCVNPAHMEVLELHTHRLMHWKERVDQTTVAEIKHRLKTTYMSYAEIGAECGVAMTTVASIAQGQRWGVSGEVLKPPPKSCPWCGEPVIDRDRRAKFCCHEHKDAYNNRLRLRRARERTQRRPA